MTEKQTDIDSYIGEKENSTESKVEFQELISGIRNGIYQPDDEGEEVSLVKMKELFNNRKINGDGEYDKIVLNEKNISKLKLEDGDLLFARTSKVREGTGKCVKVEDPNQVLIPESNMMRVRLDATVADSDYYFYYFNSIIGRKEIKKRIRQTSVSSIAQSDLKEIEVFNPSIESQQKISSKLKIFDDKIDVNKRINNILEKIAETIYKSWYVNFEPYDEFTQSELGEIPTGWKVGKLGEIMQRKNERVEPDNLPNSTPYISLDHMPEGSIVLGQSGEASEVSSQKYKFNRGDILFGKLRPYFCKVGPAPIEGICSTDILVITPKKSPSWKGFLLCHLTNGRFIDYCDKVSTGTGLPRVSWDDMCEYEIPIPPENEIERFNQHFQPIMEKIFNNIYESDDLVELRDTLIPKIIRGDISIGPETHN